MSQNNMPAPDPEDEHKDLMAMIAAGRDLGPEMDKALADSYMERHKNEQKHAEPQAQPVVPQQPQQSWGASPWNLTAFGALPLILFIMLLVVSGGHLWWLIFVWPAFFGMGWRRWGYGNHGEQIDPREQRRMMRDQYRQQRRMMRDQWIYGALPPQNIQPPFQQPAPTQVPVQTPAPIAPPAPAPRAQAPQAQSTQAPEPPAEPSQPPYNPAG